MQVSGALRWKKERAGHRMGVSGRASWKKGIFFTGFLHICKLGGQPGWATRRIPSGREERAEAEAQWRGRRWSISGFWMGCGNNRDSEKAKPPTPHGPGQALREAEGTALGARDERRGWT